LAQEFRRPEFWHLRRGLSATKVLRFRAQSEGITKSTVQVQPLGAWVKAVADTAEGRHSAGVQPERPESKE
jgi:hypothetical protein